MKNLKIFAVILFVMGMIASSCEGPEGPRGPAGTAGTDGTDGTDGNANVICYGFPGVTMGTTSTSTYLTLPLTDAMVDSSLILPYFYTAGLWFQAGQVGLNAEYLTRYYIYPGGTSADAIVKIMNVDATTYTGADQIWDSMRVFVIPASQFRAAEQFVDFSNYKEVKDYFGTK